ncbi:MAG TPA: hypothetical protein VNT03_01870 [Baekduia sp.]|nr:hypothetical protein [Baekduia sp.]
MAPVPRQVLLALACIALLGASLATGAAAVAASAPGPTERRAAATVKTRTSTAPRVGQDAVSYMKRKLDDLVTRSGPQDTLYFTAGTWHVGTDACNRCPLGGAVVAAELAKRVQVAQRARYRTIARQTVERYLATQRSDGGFPSLADPRTPDGIENEFAGVQLGTVYHLIAADLPAATRARWARAIRRSAQYIVASGMTTWYANGNINLGVTIALGLAWQATGDPALHEAYEQSWSFTLHPPKPRWADYGLRFTKAPTQPSWADGAGYLVEAGATPGFDAHYAQLQAGIATRGWLMLGDARAFRLANALTNALLPRVDADEQLDTGSGSRHPVAGLRFPFITASAAAVGRCRGGLPSAESQLRSVVTWFDRNLDPGSPENNNAWLSYLGTDVASFAMLDDAPACPTSAQLAAAARASSRR